MENEIQLNIYPFKKTLGISTLTTMFTLVIITLNLSYKNKTSQFRLVSRNLDKFSQTIKIFISC